MSRVTTSRRVTTTVLSQQHCVLLFVPLGMHACCGEAFQDCCVVWDEQRVQVRGFYYCNYSDGTYQKEQTKDTTAS